MAKKVIGINCVYSSSIVEIPYDEKYGVSAGNNVIFKDIEGKEEYGVIKYMNTDASDEANVLTGSKILRLATANDLQRVEGYMEQGPHSIEIVNSLIKKHGVEMNIFSVGYSFDGTRVHFMFTADDRVDFRELVKDLAKGLKKQIHLRQIGPRDKAKLIGGYGKCGRPLCCSSFLEKMESINMEMVREQGLESKGSSKLSGACGKLFCCLKYEIESYRDLRKGLPLIGSAVRLKKSSVFSAKEGLIVGLDVLCQKVKVQFDEKESGTVPVAEIEKILKVPSRSSAPRVSYEPAADSNPIS